MMACPDGMDTEAAFTKALAQVATWRVLGSTLEFHDAAGNRVARFQAARMTLLSKSRLEAFSDGVLAIIITIMVLELKVPHGTDARGAAPARCRCS